MKNAVKHINSFVKRVGAQALSCTNAYHLHQHEDKGDGHGVSDTLSRVLSATAAADPEPEVGRHDDPADTGR